jgi:hypothetical protein
MTADDIRRHNERYVLTIVTAALEDLLEVRQAAGEHSAAYARQHERTLALIGGSLQAVLTAARDHLQARARAGSCPPTETD